MKVAVAGGFGFLGTNVTRKLAEEGQEALPFSRRTGVDIRELNQVDSFLSQNRPEILINCAAHVGGIAYNELAPVEVYEDNLLIGLNLVRACHQNGVKKLVNIMPNCTYPGVAEVYREGGWWDGEMHDTVITYGMPRKAIWVQCWAYRKKYGFRSIHLVLPNLYGPGDHFDPVRSHALGALIKKVVEAKVQNSPKVEIWGTGSPVREWGYVEDAAEGIIRAMKQYDDLQILNLGSGQGYTISEIAEMVREAVGWNGEFVYDTTRPDGAPKKVMDTNRMKQFLGWQPETPIREGIKKAVAWYIEKLSLKEQRR